MNGTRAHYTKRVSPSLPPSGSMQFSKSLAGHVSEQNNSMVKFFVSGILFVEFRNYSDFGRSRFGSGCCAFFVMFCVMEPFSCRALFIAFIFLSRAGCVVQILFIRHKLIKKPFRLLHEIGTQRKNGNCIKMSVEMHTALHSV